jgi:hypothetical protein
VPDLALAHVHDHQFLIEAGEGERRRQQIEPRNPSLQNR